ncbi:MAG: DUF2085 domain-containing protein [Eubacteriales bacterium]|nr:DUF2085 domain-containing protein [Eubacteriales bacterium]
MGLFAGTGRFKALIRFITVSMIKHFTEWCYKWLPIIMGCHCRPDRSFFIKGRQLPVCARCTGILIGFLIAVITLFFFRADITVLLLMLLPLIIDGAVQRLTHYESNNILRLATGILFGFAATSFFAISVIATFKFGYRLGKALFV